MGQERKVTSSTILWMSTQKEIPLYSVQLTSRKECIGSHPDPYDSISGDQAGQSHSPSLSSPYLEERVAHGQLPQGGHGNDLRQQMRPEKVGDVLVYMEVGVAHPHLGQGPVPHGVTGKEDGAVGAWGLAKLWEERGDE